MSAFTGKLIYRAASGDQDAITELYELTYSSVYKTVKAMIADEDTVLDIVQDSYIKGFQSLNQLDSPENFRAWMKRIATNKAKDYLKKKKPILFTDMAADDGEEVDFRDDCLDHCPEEVLDSRETTRLMQEILSTLSEDQRLVIGMFYYEEMSVREIAETLGCSENTVKSRLNYGRRKVEARVKELEKRGTRLYSMAPLAFLLWLFRMDARTAEIPSGIVWKAIVTKCAVPGAAAVGTGAKPIAETGAKAIAETGAKAIAGTGAKAIAGTGAKAVVTKIIAGVLAAAVVGGGAAAVISSQNRAQEEALQQIIAAEAVQQRENALLGEEEAETSAPAEEAAVSAITAEEAYAGILAEYRAVLETDSAAFFDAPENYFHGDHVIIRYYHMYHGDSFYSACMDIDGNGTEELLIGAGVQDNIKIVDLYSFDGEQAVQLIDEPTLGDRSTLSLLEDHTLYLVGSSGAADTSFTYHQVDGCTVTEVSPSSAAEVTDIPWIALVHPQTEQEVTNDAVNAEAAYAQVIAALQSACAVDSQQWLSDPDTYHQQYSDLNTVMLDFYHQYGETEIYYAYADLDGNGTDELIISHYYLGEPRHVISSIYTFDGTNAVEIIERGENNIVDICADGSIMVSAGTIIQGVIYLYVLDADGIYPDNIAIHTFDLYTDTYQSESETLSSQEYYANYVPNGYWTLEWNYLCG